MRNRIRPLNGRPKARARPKPRVKPPVPPRRPKRPVKPAESRYTTCPGNGIVHNGFALKISRSGKTKCPTVRCPVCKSRVFLDREKFPRGTGLTMTQVKAWNLQYFED